MKLTYKLLYILLYLQQL